MLNKTSSDADYVNGETLLVTGTPIQRLWLKILSNLDTSYLIYDNLFY